MAGKNAVPTNEDFDAAADLLGTDSNDESSFDGLDDLLNEVVEDDAEAWNPTERGAAIAGVIIKMGETKSDFAKPNEDPMVPTVTVQNRDGKFRIIGYASVLKRELADQIENGNIKLGNLLAVKYWGEKLIKSGPFADGKRTFRHFTVVAQAPKPRV